jgi:ABC-2 type transport system permease protein
MNSKMIGRLIWKDWYLQRWVILASFVGGAISLAIIAMGGKVGFLIGLILLITVLISIGAQLAVSTIVQERKDQTLTFVMSLPTSYREYTASKMLGNLVIFLVVWLVMVLSSIALLAYPWDPHMGLIPFTAIMATEILLSTCLVVATALITESQGWTIGAIMVGNLALNFLGYWVAHIHNIASGMESTKLMWTSSASVLLIAEFCTIALLLGLTFFFQSRKRDFL